MGGNYIRCQACGAEGGWSANVEGAIKKWNLRKGATSIKTLAYKFMLQQMYGEGWHQFWEGEGE